MASADLYLFQCLTTVENNIGLITLNWSTPFTSHLPVLISDMKMCLNIYSACQKTKDSIAGVSVLSGREDLRAGVRPLHPGRRAKPFVSFTLNQKTPFLKSLSCRGERI